MKSPSVLKNHAREILDNFSSDGNDENEIDATGQESGFTDYNFDILRQHYAGTDFETEANSLCDIMSSIHAKTGDIGQAGPVFIKIRGALKGDDGNIHPGFEPFDDFAGMVEEMLNQVMRKSNISPGMDAPPLQTEQPPPELQDMEDLPNIEASQAKLMELEQYVKGMNLDQRQKWKDYLAEARKLAAVGDDSFNAMPELDYEDMAYLKESERQKMNRNSVKNAMLQRLIGVNQATPGI